MSEPGIARSSEASVIAAIAAVFRSHGALGDALDDDTALLPAQPMTCERVVTTDVVVEGRDFDRALYPLVHAGARALVQNLSDLASAGAVPVGFVWSLAIPPSWSLADVEDFCAGAAGAAARHHAPLLGGDLSRTGGPMVCNITAFGDVAGARLTRRGARPGQGVWLSRRTGASAAGLRALKAGLREGTATGLAARAIAAHLSSDPELMVGRALVGVASACIDVSDGLLLDLSRLAATSGVALDLDALDGAIDGAAGASAADAFGGGEDWALVFTADPDAALPAGCLRLGQVTVGEGLWRAGVRLAPQGYDHFAT